MVGLGGGLGRAASSLVKAPPDIAAQTAPFDGLLRARLGPDRFAPGRCRRRGRRSSSTGRGATRCHQEMVTMAEVV